MGVKQDSAQTRPGSGGKKNLPSNVVSLGGEVGTQRPESSAPAQAARADFLPGMGP